MNMIIQMITLEWDTPLHIRQSSLTGRKNNNNQEVLNNTLNLSWQCIRRKLLMAESLSQGRWVQRANQCILQTVIRSQHSRATELVTNWQTTQTEPSINSSIITETTFEFILNCKVSLCLHMLHINEKVCIPSKLYTFKVKAEYQNH